MPLVRMPLMARRRGMSARVKLTLSYAGFLMVAGVLLLAVVNLFLLRYIPDVQINANLRVPNRSDLVRAFTPPTVASLIFLLILGLVGGWFLAGRMLAPLTRLNDAARLAAEGSLSHRVDMPGSKDEFRDLADVFDTMLERLERHVDEQRRFAANASHELRTPLAVSQAMLEVARDDPDRDVDVLIARLQSVNSRAIALTEALLLLARADGSPQRFYSLSAQIQRERKAYYDILERTQKRSMDVTEWLAWFLDTLHRAVDQAQHTLDSVLTKARFWQHWADTPLNERQVKLLNRLLDGFEGKLTNSKWAAIAKCSPDTALRDINDLLARGVLRKSNAGGRSTSYELNDLP